MKLLFPNGEHAPIELKHGLTRVGGAPSSELLLMAPGIASEHCQIKYDQGQVSLHVTNPANPVALNGRQVTGDAPIKPGDIILFGRVGARVVGVEKSASPPPVTRPVALSEPDDGRTRVRQALPKFILRGVSGSTFGKNFALAGTMTVGRQADCDICIPSDEVSRRHAKLQVLPDGIAVEDIGSANGTFINDKRIHTGMLKPGEELRLDTMRFLLVAPHLDAQKPAEPTGKPEPAAAASAGGATKWVVMALIGAVVVIVALFASGALGH
ncbi:MAG: FHA domain-containing protein [Lysobacterales bacterium]